MPEASVRIRDGYVQGADAGGGRMVTFLLSEEWDADEPADAASTPGLHRISFDDLFDDA